MNESSNLFWRGVSSVHDWTDGGPALLLVQNFHRRGWLGDLEWSQNEWNADPTPAEGSLIDWVQQICNKVDSSEEDMVFAEAGGSLPSPWVVTLALSPFDKKTSKVMGQNVVALTFDPNTLDGLTSDQLIEVFESTHHAHNTEHAMIHPELAWDRLDEVYRESPVTVATMFLGVAWANYLGPGHLDEFNLEALKQKVWPMIHWDNEHGLWFYAADHFEQTFENGFDAELIAMSEQMICCLKSDHRWSDGT